MCCVLSRSVVSDSLRPHGVQLAKLHCLWDFPGKNTGESHGQRSLAGHRLEKNLPQLSNSACVRRGAKSLALSHKHREKGLGDLNPGLMPKP